MLLVITPSAKARGCAQAIQQVTSEETHVAATSSQALARLRAQEYVAVLIDQAFLETEPVESDMVLEHIGTAVPVHVNFAINNMDRVGRELRAALHRHKRAGPAGPARGTARTAKRTQGRHHCAAALMRNGAACPRSPERSRKQDARLSTSLPRKYVSSSKVLYEFPASGNPTSALLDSKPKCNILRTCGPCRKSFTDIALPALQ